MGMTLTKNDKEGGKIEINVLKESYQRVDSFANDTSLVHLLFYESDIT